MMFAGDNQKKIVCKTREGIVRERVLFGDEEIRERKRVEVERNEKHLCTISIKESTTR